MKYAIQTTRYADHQPGIQAVRRQVFIEEQGIDPTLEWDTYDSDAVFAIALNQEKQVIGTGRLLSNGKIGRMAVLPEYRRQGVGTALLLHLLTIAKHHGYSQVTLAAQQSVTSFYSKQGFIAVGPAHIEAGMPHQNMRRPI